MSGREYQNNFRSPIWENLLIDERLKILQELENQYSRKDNRRAYTVIATKLGDTSYRGRVDHTQKEILVNLNFLEKGEMLYWVVDFILHAGFHACQFDTVVRSDAGSDNRQLELLRMNFEKYVESTETSKVVYRWQPLEREAFGFAGAEVDKIGNRLEQKYGPNERYMQYSLDRDRINLAYTVEAIEQFGLDYEGRIDRVIYRKNHQIDIFAKMNDNTSGYHLESSKLNGD